MGVAAFKFSFNTRFFPERRPGQPSKCRRSLRKWIALFAAANLAGLTTTLALENLRETDPSRSSEPAALEKAEADVVDSALGSEEQALVAEAATRSHLDPTSLIESQPADLSAAEPVLRENAPTPRRFQYAVSLSLRGVYDNNINITNSNRESDFYAAIEPHLSIGFGTHEENFLALSYYPSAFIFANHSEDNALQHAVRLEGQYRFPRLTLTASQEVQLLDGSDLGTTFGTGTVITSSGAGRVNLDVSARTRVNVYNTRLDGNYSLTGKLFLTGGLAYNRTDYASNSLIDSSVVSANTYLNYTYSPKLNIGLGLAGGYDMVSSPSQDQIYEELNLRASYELTGKVSVGATLGLEFRQYSGPGSGDSVSPVLDATLAYQPFDGTNVSLNLSSRTLNSATLGGEDYHNTLVSLGLQQRLFQRFFLGLNVGYESSIYFSTTNGVASNREDNYYFFEPSVDFTITRFWSVGFYFLYRENNSSLTIFSFDDTQIGARSTLTF